MLSSLETLEQKAYQRAPVTAGSICKSVHLHIDKLKIVIRK